MKLEYLATPWLPYAMTVASALPIAALVAAENPQPAGACSGIGFGCSVYGWEAAFFVMVLVGAPYAGGLLVAVGLLTLLPRDWRVLSTIVAWVGFVLPWLAVAATQSG